MFTEDDTAAAVALAEEEADTCPSCGMPKAWCRDNTSGRARFEVAEEFCWATYRMSTRSEKWDKEKMSPAQRHATQLGVRFRPGYEPEIDAGLELGAEVGGGEE